MRILLLSVEVSPISKVGGLADVAGGLAKALKGRGHDVRVITPRHRHLNLPEMPHTIAREVAVPPFTARAALSAVSLGDVPVYLVENGHYFDRESVYGYPDDPDRWLFFCDAVLTLASHLNWRPDVLHLNDWHTGFLATRLAHGRRHAWRGLGRLFTIHNLGVRGDFDAGFGQRFGLPRRALSDAAGVAAYSAMAQAVRWSDYVTTVSPTFAREILTPEYGNGLDPLLRWRRSRLAGILNGIDYDEFDPSSDRYLASRFDASSLEKRPVNKAALQKEAGLTLGPAVPLAGVVARLYPQKGVDLVCEAAPSLLKVGRLQLIIVGVGDPAHEAQARRLAEQYPGRVAYMPVFDARLAQLVYGGADLFLMPSRFEPCGLGQMIAMRYGAVPVVRRTGGLADTVIDAGAAEGATGFVFDAATPAALRDAIERALAAFGDRDAWRALILNGMRRDFSWAASALEYEEAYARALRYASRRAETTGV
jgi:starch synthase